MMTNHLEVTGKDHLQRRMGTTLTDYQKFL